MVYTHSDHQIILLAFFGASPKEHCMFNDHVYTSNLVSRFIVLNSDKSTNEAMKTTIYYIIP